MQLTSDQEKAWAVLKSFLLTSDRFFVLNGYAGTGKTFLLQELYKTKKSIEQVLSNPNGKLLFTATTNKAVEVLQQQGLPAKTIHSFLGLIPTQTGYNKVRETDSHEHLVVVDEASMIDEKLMGFLKDSPHRYIFVGDDTQLPPVFGRSVVFDYPQVKLTQIIRQEPGTLQELVSALRAKVEGNSFTGFETDDKEVFWCSLDDFQATMLADFTSDDWSFTKSKYVGYTNNRCIKENQRVELHKNGTLVINKGDVLINNTYKRTKGITFTNNETIVIEDTKDPVSFQGHLLFPVKVKGLWQYVPSHLSLYETSYVHMLLDLRGVYACTVHKAQGSTFDRVYINLSDIKQALRRSEDMFWRLLYVAVSRARKQVVFTGKV